MGIPLFPRRHAGSSVFLALSAGAGCLRSGRALAPRALPVPTTSAALHLQAASAALGTNNTVVSSLGGFINSHLVSSFRSDLSFCQLLRATCVCPVVRGYVCLLVRPCNADPLVQPRVSGFHWCLNCWGLSLASAGASLCRGLDLATASAVLNYPFAFFMPWRGSHTLPRCLCILLLCRSFVALVIWVRNKGPPSCWGNRCSRRQRAPH